MIAHCTQCQHEWQAVREPGKCDWCGAPGKQPLHLMILCWVLVFLKLANDYIESRFMVERSREERKWKGPSD